MAGEMASGQKRCPELVTRSWSSASVCGRTRCSAAGWKLCADPDDTQLGERARRPPLGRACGDNPLPRQRMVLMRWDQDGHQDVHIEQAGHY
jgi:hypothetical protein